MDSSQISGKPTVSVTYSGASGDSGVKMPTVTGIVSGDRIGFQVYTRRNVGSKRIKVTAKWQNAAGTSTVSETLWPYLTRTIGYVQVHTFQLTAPQSIAIGGVYMAIRAVYDTPTNGDNFSFAEPQVWKISSAA